MYFFVVWRLSEDGVQRKGVREGESTLPKGRKSVRKEGKRVFNRVKEGRV